MSRRGVLGGREGDQIVTVAAQEVEFPVTPEQEPQIQLRGEIPELYFCQDLAGYGWCFRKGNYLNIGLGRLNSPGVSAHVQSFCQFLRDRGKVCCDMPSRFHGHAYRIYERIAPKLIEDRVLFIGDAAGLAYPQSGEGIRPAVESGLMAADVLIAGAASIAERISSPTRGRLSIGSARRDEARFPIDCRRPFCNSRPVACWRTAGLRGTWSSISGSCTRRRRLSPFPSGCPIHVESRERLSCNLP